MAVLLMTDQAFFREIDSHGAVLVSNVFYRVSWAVISKNSYLRKQTQVSTLNVVVLLKIPALLHVFYKDRVLLLLLLLLLLIFFFFFFF